MADKVKKQMIELGGPHTHRGEEFGKGDLIEVREDQAANLIEHHGAKKASADQVKAFNDAKEKS